MLVCFIQTTQRVNYQVTETQIIVRGPGCFHVKEKLKERNFAWSKNELHWFLPRGKSDSDGPKIIIVFIMI